MKCSGCQRRACQHDSRRHGSRVTAVVSAIVAALITLLGGAAPSAAAVSYSNQFMTVVSGSVVLPPTVPQCPPVPVERCVEPPGPTVPTPESGLNFGFGASGVTGTYEVTRLQNSAVDGHNSPLGGPNASTFLEPDPPAASAHIRQHTTFEDRVNGVDGRVVLSEPVADLTLHVVNLDGSGLTVSGTSTTGAPITLVPVVKNNEMTISTGSDGTALNRSPLDMCLPETGCSPQINPGCETNAGANPNGACGSFVLRAATGLIRSFTLSNEGYFLQSDDWGWTLSFPTDPPSISGTKFEDLNGDGGRDGGEPGLGGWTIGLYNDGVRVATTTTDAAGNYSFELDGDAYDSTRFEVREVMKAGWEQSRAPAAIVVPLTAGNADFGDRDFGNYRPARIAGVKYEDMNADGDRDAGDPGLEGWTITLAGGPTAGSDVTSASGAYALTGLRPGTYSVAETLKAGWRYSTPADGSHTITLRSGDAETLVFGNYRPATVTGIKYHDANANGAQDSDEPVLPGWLISLSNGTTQTTAADGSYQFSGLRPSDTPYTLSETQQDGHRQTAPAPAGGGTHSVTLHSGQSAGPLAFGNVCLGSASVGVRDISTGQPVLGAEMRIEEIDVNDDVITNDPALPKTTTDGTFTELLPGRYRVIVFLPAGQYSKDPDTRVVDGRWATVKEITVVACQTTELNVETFSRSRGKVSGSIRISLPSGFATASFGFQTNSSGETTGRLQYKAQNGPTLRTDQIDDFYVTDDGTEAYIWGTVDYDGQTLPFRLHLVDLGEPATLDRFELDVLDTYQAGHGTTLVGGNVQIRN